MRSLVAILLLVWGNFCWAETIAEINNAVADAFGAGDTERAKQLTEDVLQIDQAIALQQSADFLAALNNAAFLATLENGSDARAQAAADRAVEFAVNAGLIETVNGLNALANATHIHAMALNAEISRALRQRYLGIGRRSEYAKVVLPATVDLAFLNRDFVELPFLIEEMIDVSGGYAAQTNLEQFYAAQNALEEAGDIAGTSALIDARILVVSQLAPHLVEQFAHDALWPKFLMNYRAENFAKAAEALKQIAATGTFSAENREFISAQAEKMLILTQYQGFGDRTGVQLGFAELTVVFAELAYTQDDPRIGFALRERAYAEAQLGRYETAAATLHDALVILERSDEGKRAAFLVLEDLASNAWQRDRLENAQRLFERAAVAREAAIKDGIEPLSSMEQSILALNRARLAIELGDQAQAQALIDEAKADFAEFKASGAAKKNDLRHSVSIAEAEALLAAETGDVEASVVLALDLINAAKTQYAAPHPARALALTNAADQLLALGRADLARGPLTEAYQIAERSYGANSLQFAEIALKIGLDALADGNRMAAADHFRKAVAVHQAPENRAGLSQALDSFEFLAWYLLAEDNPNGAAVDEALAALQWTQSSQSAESYAMMAARLIADDPSVAKFMKARQDALAALADNQSALNVVYAQGEDPTAFLDRRARLQSDLAEADAALSEMDIALTGQTGIASLTLNEIQSLLSENEVLVTFLLPGLKPSAVDGLEYSSNLAIAVTRDSFRVAVIPEALRGELNGKIDAFRCQMAVSDQGCGDAGRGGLRGAMTLESKDESDNSFDWQVAHDLYTDLLGGFTDLIQPGDQIIFVPPSDLLRLPFQALITEPQLDFSLDAADWLIRRNAVSVLPSIAALSVLKSQPTQAEQAARFLGFGDPDIGTGPDLACDEMQMAELRSPGSPEMNLYGGEVRDGLRLADAATLRAMSRLPDATCELRQIERAFGPNASTLRTRGEATETELKRLNHSGALMDYDLLVFATHGVVAGETSAIAPGLVMTPPDQPSIEDDGLLTAAEVATLTMRARLVILSACNTAAGKDASNEGLSGLASGFFHAGAKSALVTHWAVYSAAAAEISASVSAGLIDWPERSNARNLQATVLNILADPNRGAFQKHPSYWAAFTLVGL